MRSAFPSQLLLHVKRAIQELSPGSQPHGPLVPFSPDSICAQTPDALAYFLTCSDSFHGPSALDEATVWLWGQRLPWPGLWSASALPLQLCQYPGTCSFQLGVEP